MGSGPGAKKKTAVQNQDKIAIGELIGTFSLFDDPKEAPVAEHGAGNSDAANVLQTLQKLAEALGRDYTVSTLLDRIMDEVIELVNAEKGFLVLVEDGVPRICVARNVNRETLLDAEGMM